MLLNNLLIVISCVCRCGPSIWTWDTATSSPWPSCCCWWRELRWTAGPVVYLCRCQPKRNPLKQRAHPKYYSLFLSIDFTSTSLLFCWLHMLTCQQLPVASGKYFSLFSAIVWYKGSRGLNLIISNCIVLTDWSVFLQWIFVKYN